MDVPQDDWLTAAQAADALGLSASTVYLQIARGRIATVRVGQQHRISPAEIARYRRDYLGHSGWHTRRAPDHPPSRNTTYSRRSRVRRREIGDAMTPADVEARLTGRPDTAAVTGILDIVRSDPAWAVHELTLPGRVAVIEIEHHPSGRAYTLRRRQGRVRWRLEGNA